MKILVVGESPFRLTSAGKINADLIKYLGAGNEISAASWSFDTSWFLADENKDFWYEKDNQKICRVYPFINASDKAAPQLYEIMKKTQPDLVVSVGGYEQTAFISSVKSIYPDLFKWVAVMLIEAGPLSETHREAFDQMDCVVVTNMSAIKHIQEISNVNCICVHYGPDHDIFKAKSHKEEKTFRAMMNTSNTILSNLGAFTEGVSAVRCTNLITGYLHTNIFDKGFYDVQAIVDREFCKGAIEIPKTFVSHNDGITDEEMVDEYNKSDVIVDCSMASATGLTILEGMACGCVPVMSTIGAMQDIYNGFTDFMCRKYPDDSFFLSLPLSGIPYLGYKDKEYNFVSSDSVRSEINSLKNMKEYQKENWNKMTDAAVEFSKKYSNKIFCGRIKDIIQETMNKKSAIVLEIP